MERNYKISILVADDHEFYLDGLKGFFTDNELYEIVGEASNGEELVKNVVIHEPHIVLTDLRMPLLDGARAIREITRVSPQTKCIVLTNYDNDLSIVEALEAGAKGYITKNMPRKDLFTALDQICRGYPYYCLTTNTRMIRLLSRSQFNPYLKGLRPTFTETEKKIIQLICQEKNNKEIAEKLYLSIRTVENNRSRIYQKMQVKTTAGVAIYAIKHGFVMLDDE